MTKTLPCRSFQVFRSSAFSMKHSIDADCSLFPRVFCLCALLVLGGCSVARISSTSTIPESTGPEIPAHDSRYQPEHGRDATFIVNMRAAPPPAEPAVEDGKQAAGDLRLMNGRGYVRIGVGHYQLANPDARADAIDQGRAVGADEIFFYRIPATSGNSDTSAQNMAENDGELRAVYFVRLKLVFGATFRNLDADERSRVGGKSGVEIGSVIGGTPASEANLRAGDLVLAMENVPVRDKSDFQNRLKAKAGQHVMLTVYRNGASQQRLVRLGVIASDKPGASSR